MKYIIFLALAFVSFPAFNQEINEIYIKIDNEKDDELFELNKSEESINLRVIFFEKRDEGFKKRTVKKNDEIVIVEPLPNENYYEFNSFGRPKKVKSINKFDYYNIIDISKHKVWNDKYPHKMIFIEKLNDCYYNLWKIYPIMNE